jgi:hypothetical protein
MWLIIPLKNIFFKAMVKFLFVCEYADRGDIFNALPLYVAKGDWMFVPCWWNVMIVFVSETILILTLSS